MGDSVRLCSFSGDLGKQTIHLASISNILSKDDNIENAGLDLATLKINANPLAVVEQYVAGRDHFGEDLDQSILTDMKRIG